MTAWLQIVPSLCWWESLCHRCCHAAVFVDRVTRDRARGPSCSPDRLARDRAGFTVPSLSLYRRPIMVALLAPWLAGSLCCLIAVGSSLATLAWHKTTGMRSLVSLSRCFASSRFWYASLYVALLRFAASLVVSSRLAVVCVNVCLRCT